MNIYMSGAKIEYTKLEIYFMLKLGKISIASVNGCN